MDNKISLDISNIYLMQPHASVDPLYGPYQSINDAVSALSGDNAGVVKPGFVFAVKDGYTYKQYIVSSVYPFDYEPAQGDSFVVGDSGSISWRVDSLNINYADVKVGTGITEAGSGISLNVGSGITIGSDNSTKLKLGSGVKFDLVDAVEVNAGAGLQLKQDGTLAIQDSIIDTVQQMSNLSFGSGLRKSQEGVVSVYADGATTYTNDSGQLCVSLSTIAGKGLTTQGHTILLRLGSGLGFGNTYAYNNPVSVKIGTGLQFDDDDHSTVLIATDVMASIANANVTYGNGLQKNDNNEVSVRLGDGLLFTNYGYVTLRRKDNTLVFDNGATRVNLDSSHLELGTDGIRTKLSSGLYADSNGLHVKLSTAVISGFGTDSAGGLFIKTSTGIGKTSDDGLYVKVGTGISLGLAGLYIQAQHPVYIDSLNKLNLKLSSDLVHDTVDDYGQTLTLSTDPYHQGLGARYDRSSIVLGNNGLCVNVDNNTISIGTNVHVNLDAMAMKIGTNGISPKVDNASIIIGTDGSGLRVNTDGTTITIGTTGIQSRGLIIKRMDAGTQQYVEVGNTNDFGGQLLLGSGVTAYINNNELRVEADLDFLDLRYQRIL